MPRPQTKTDLLNLSQESFDKLLSIVDQMDPILKMKAFPDQYMNRNIRDVLAHLHAWHLLFLEWYRIGMKGDKPDMPAPGYTWKTTGTLNKKIQEDYSSSTLSGIIRKLKRSHGQVMTIINRHSQEELFTKKKYKWTGSTSLGAYLVSSTSSHYNWALKLIKKALM